MIIKNQCSARNEEIFLIQMEENIVGTVTEIRVWVEQTLRKDLVTHASEEKTVLLHYKWGAQPLEASPPDSLLQREKSFLAMGRIPYEWGTLVRFLTSPLLEGISSPESLPLTVLIAYTQVPTLLLLLKIIVTYSTMAKAGRKDPEDEIITRSEAQAQVKESSALCTIGENAQELLDLLKLLPTLRNGGARLLPRLVACIDKILEADK